MYEPEGIADIIFKDRYAAHKEETWQEACERVSTAVARAEENGKFLIWKKRYYDLLVDGKFCPAGRIWYGSGRPKQQLMNCFVLGVEDSREGWGKAVGDMIVVSGTGGGVGINGSTIRPRGTKIHGTGGEATGAVSFFDIVNAAGEVIKGGGGRRTALMFCLDVAHPDVVEFIDKKFSKVKRDTNDPEEIIAFIKEEFGLYSLPDPMEKSIEHFASMDSEYKKEDPRDHWDALIQNLSDIFLQRNLKNANVSIMFSEDPEIFFGKVRNDESWDLKWQEEVVATVSAKELWHKIISNFIEGGEPGILNGHLANKMNNLHYLYWLHATNPCITGDTLIALADGRNAVSIEDLTNEGKDIPVYSTNLKTGKVEIKMGRDPRRTGRKKEVWKLTLNDGSILRATPDHRILKRDLKYCELKDLAPGDSVFPFDPLSSFEVVSVEFVGNEDVFNITVDDNHNYHVVTKSDDDDFMKSSGICVKNCGEQYLEYNGACDLGSIVLHRFLNEEHTDFDWDELADAVTAGVRFLDDVLSVNSYPLQEISQNCQEVRRVGLGVMALHDSLLMMGIKYSSEEGLKKIDELFSFIKNKAYEASTYLAVEKGVFPKYDRVQFLKSGFTKKLKRSVRAKIKEYGVRNCCLLTVAPTGTTSILMGCPSSGIEPIFAPAWWRIFFSPDGTKRRELVFHPLFKKMYEEGKSLKHFESAYFIRPEQHMAVQSTVQKHIDNAVSKTINIPAEGFSLEEFSDALMKYLPKLKGCTVYKAGSRGDEPLQALSIHEAIKLLEEKADAKVEVDSDQLLKQDCPDGICSIG